jgi:small subunit ribosomal protein S21
MIWLGCIFRERMPSFSLTGFHAVFQASNNVLLRKEVNRLTQVNLRPNESQDQLLRRFRKKVAKSGILSTVRRKRWFVSKSELRRIQKKKAIRRLKRRQQTDGE